MVDTDNYVVNARVNLLFLRKAAENGWMTDFAYFLKFKYIFDSSMLVKGNLSKLSRLTGHDVKTCRYRIGRMLNRGWVKKDAHGNFIFCSLEELWGGLKKNGFLRHYRRFSCSTITFNINDSARVIRDQLVLFRVKSSVKGQRFAIRLKQDVAALSAPRRMSPSMRVTRKENNIRCTAVHQMGLSQRDLGDIVDKDCLPISISCSRFGVFDGMTGKSNGCLIKRRLIKQGKIIAEKQLEQVFIPGMQFIGHVTPEEWHRIKSKLPDNCYYFRNEGKVMRRLADTITICQPSVSHITNVQQKALKRMIVE